ncbi:MAG TPA: transposase [Gammaproteobacteria bacterium]|nr:transposase [Gammaproteobacteria bacterium]
MLGYVDEVWWSRLAQPPMHTWSFERRLRLHELAHERREQEPKALACYGVLFPQQQEDRMLLRFVEGRPVSSITCRFLEWVSQRLAAAGTRVWALIWDNASWHRSQRVRQWIREHNERVKRAGGVRIVMCCLPVKSPWLNPIEPKWLHGKQAIVEPERKLTAPELIERVHAHYGCEHVELIAKETA